MFVLPITCSYLHAYRLRRSQKYLIYGTDALGRRLGVASCLAMVCRHGTVSVDMLIHPAVLISVLLCVL